MRTSSISPTERALASACAHVARVESELEEESQRARDLEEEVRKLTSKLGKEREKYRALWCANCEQLAESDELIVSKDEDIQVLKDTVSSLETELSRIAVTEPSIRPPCAMVDHSEISTESDPKGIAIKNGGGKSVLGGRSIAEPRSRTVRPLTVPQGTVSGIT